VEDSQRETESKRISGKVNDVGIACDRQFKFISPLEKSER